MSGIRALKVYGWESWMFDKVVRARAHETSALARQQYLYALNANLGVLGPLLVNAATLITYAHLSKGPLDSSTAFAAMAWLNMLRQPIAMVPSIVTAVIQWHISLRRLEDFFLEGSTTVSGDAEPPPASSAVAPPLAVDARDAGFSWDGDARACTLDGVSLQVPAGAFVCIVGPVGSGKSTLLAALAKVPPRVVFDVNLLWCLCGFIFWRVSSCAGCPMCSRLGAEREPHRIRVPDAVGTERVCEGQHPV